MALGGAIAVSDAPDYPALEASMALTRVAAAGGVPALGICLGGQVAAHALGRWTRRADGEIAGFVAEMRAMIERHARAGQVPGADICA